MKEKLLISACLCGENCKYNGGNNLLKQIDSLKEKYELFYMCPECSGGLKHPRCPSEIRNGRVFGSDGIEVTSEFLKGANITLKKAKKYNIKKALLKESSPSCGVHKIYDGNFTKTKIPGLGITAKLLLDNGITLYSEEDIELLI